MNSIVAVCKAKINLSLNILGKNESLHYIDSVMIPISLCDIVFAKKRQDLSVNITFFGDGFDTDSITKNNTVQKAVDLLTAEYKGFGVDVFVQKNLPVGGGLGGSSADAAGAILAINALFGLENNQDKLYEIAKRVGSDVPFSMMSCVAGWADLYDDSFIAQSIKSDTDPFEAVKLDKKINTVGFGARVMGTGDLLCPIKNNHNFFIVVATKAGLSVQSGDAYRQFDKMQSDYKLLLSDNDMLIKALSDDSQDAFKFMGNALTDASENLCPQIKDIKKQLYCQGAFFALMSGSGACVVGFFETEEKASRAKINLNQKGYWAK